MARKSKGDGCLGVLATGAAVVFSLLPLLILVGAIGGAVALLVMWVVSWWKVRRLPKAPGANAFVMLPSEERAMVDARRQEVACEAALEELRRRGAHLSRKKDGTYNEVSKLGKELNPLVRAKNRELSSATLAAQLAASISHARHAHYCDTVGHFRSMSWTLVIMSVTTNALMLTDAASVQALTDWFANTKSIGPIPPDFGAFVLSLFGGVVAAWLFRLLLKTWFIDRVESEVKAMPDVSASVAQAYSRAMQAHLSGS
jgi:hypothetical protein